MVAETAWLRSTEVAGQDRGNLPATQRGVVRLNIAKVTRRLWVALAIVIGLGFLREVILQIIGTETGLKELRRFAFDAEHSLPTWFEVLVMAAASALLAILAALSSGRDPENRFHWSLLAVVFLLFSIDEAVSFHEMTITPLRQALNLTGFLYFSWVIIAAPLLLAMGIYFIPFLLRLPRPTAIRFAFAGGLFVAGAFGLEFVGGYLASKGGFDYPAYEIAVTAEECLEIVGVTLFVSSLLRHLSECAPVLQIDFQGRV